MAQMILDLKQIFGKTDAGIVAHRCECDAEMEDWIVVDH
jgi:hypothetical protein